MPQPPLLPDQALARVIHVARRNGWSIVLVAAIAAMMQATQRDVLGAFTGLLAAGAGAMEVHGVGLLRAGEKRGIDWLIRAELALLVVLVAFAGLRLAYPNLTEMRAAFHVTLGVPGVRERWEELQKLGITEDQYLGLVHRLTCIGCALATVIYQGCMAAYYARRRPAVELALAEE